LIALVLYKK